jgi:hypothetical protein
LVEGGGHSNAPLIEFTQELVTKGAVPALQLALAFGCIGPAKDQMNPQPRAHALQGGGPISSTVVDNDFYR